MDMDFAWPLILSGCLKLLIMNSTVLCCWGNVVEDNPYNYVVQADLFRGLVILDWHASFLQGKEGSAQMGLKMITDTDRPYVSWFRPAFASKLLYKQKSENRIQMASIQRYVAHAAKEACCCWYAMSACCCCSLYAPSTSLGASP